MQLQTTSAESKFPNDYNDVIFIQIDQHLEKNCQNTKGSRFYETWCREWYYCSEYQTIFQWSDTVSVCSFSWRSAGTQWWSFFDGRKPSVLVIDDLVPEANQLVANILTKISHHRNISVLYITQHVLDKNKYARTISLNAHHLVLYKSPRDASQFATLARQMYPNSSKFAVERRTLIRRLYRMAICWLI